MAEWLLAGWDLGHLAYMFLLGWEIGLVMDWRKSQVLPADVV